MCSSDENNRLSNRNYFKKELLIEMSSCMKFTKIEEKINDLTTKLLNEGYIFNKMTKYISNPKNINIYLTKSRNKKIKVFSSKSISVNLTDSDLDHIYSEIKVNFN